MTEPHDPLDDLLSAHLDGATSDEEAAILAADPAAQARLAELARVQAALRAPLPVDPEAREHAIAAALSAFDDDASAATVTPLARPAARRAPSARARRVLGWAAALALLVALVPLVGQLASSSDDEDSASSAEETSEALDDRDPTSVAGDGDAGEASPSTTGSADSAAGAESASSLGAFADVEALLVAVRASSEAPRAETSFDSTSRAVAGLTPCVAQELPDDARSQPVRVTQAVVAGDEVTVVESGPPGALAITVVREDERCTLLAQELR